MRNITLNDVKDPMDKASEQNEDSFFNFKDAKVLMMEKGDILWRFSNDHEKYFSDCWLDTENMESLFRIFTEIKSQNEYGIRSANKMMKDIIHDNLAILEHWKNSKLNFVIKAEIIEPVVAYYGRIGSQQFLPRLKQNRPVVNAIENRLGGLDQFVIPRIKNNNKKGNFEENYKIAKVKDLKYIVDSSWYKKYTW